MKENKSKYTYNDRSGLRSLGTLLPVLGATWLFGILAVNENVDVFQYIFVIANSFQVSFNMNFLFFELCVKVSSVSI